MQFREENSTRKCEINTSHKIRAVLFTENGEQVLSGGEEGTLRRWRVNNGQEIVDQNRPQGAEIYAVALSSDRKWLVCGLRRYTANVVVWDARTHEKVLHVSGHANSVFTVDISPDSTKFATGGSDKLVFIRRMATGERLVGPLQHDGWAVVAVRFSPNGDRIATATGDHTDTKSIRIFDSHNGHQLLDIPFRFFAGLSSPLAWYPNGCQLLAISPVEVSRFDASSGTLLARRSIPKAPSPPSIVLSRTQKFAVIISSKSLSFWDTATCQQIGTVIEHASYLRSIALSPNDVYVVTGEENGTVIIRSLRDILPSLYLTVNMAGLMVPGHPPFWLTLPQLPFMCISDAEFISWSLGNLAPVEELLTKDLMHPPSPLHHARALACRSIVRARLKHYDMAIHDAKKSIEIQPCVIGYVASAIAYVRNGEHESGIRLFDLVFTLGLLPSENNLLLLIKATILFECGKHDDATLRVRNLINIVDDQSPYIVVLVKMFLLFGYLSRRDEDINHAIELFKRVQDAIPFQHNSNLVIISFILGWDFDGVATEIQSHLDRSRYTMTETLSKEPVNSDVTVQPISAAYYGNGDKAERPNGYGRVFEEVCPGALKRGDGDINGESWENPPRNFPCPNEAVDPSTHNHARRSIPSSRLDAIIDKAIYRVSGRSPLVLIDVKSGRLCDRPERLRLFKSDPQYKKLIRSMAETLDRGHIRRVVEQYFQYVMLSHVWQGQEPSFQNIEQAGSVLKLDSSPLNGKLRRFCGVVCNNGYRWAWSDTCCIDKTISSVLVQSLKMMYRWYKASAATFALLVDVSSPSALGDLTRSIWMRRAWTSQELLAPEVIRFYDRDWKPYLGDTRFNHKESPEIMGELANAIGVSGETIVAFKPSKLNVREKLRLASTRKATVEEDVAYSLIGIFKSDIRPDYGEASAAVGHLLEEVVARSGEVSVLDWVGKPSSYNSCLPVSLAVYKHLSSSSSTISDVEMDSRVSALRSSLSEATALLIHDQVIDLPPARFANRRLRLPCIIFTIERLAVEASGGGPGKHCASVSGIGDVRFQSLDRLPLTQPRKLVFVHPWIRNLCDPLDGFTWRSRRPQFPTMEAARTSAMQSAIIEDESESDTATDSDSAPASPPHPPRPPLDDYTRALRLIVRLQEPFRALLLQQQSNGDFKRVAARQEIVVPGIRVDASTQFRTGVVEIL